jgi:hypothetical protein
MKWLHKMVNEMENETIKPITGNHHYLNAVNTTFNN